MELALATGTRGAKKVEEHTHKQSALLSVHVDSSRWHLAFGGKSGCSEGGYVDVRRMVDSVFTRSSVDDSGGRYGGCRVKGVGAGVARMFVGKIHSIHPDRKGRHLGVEPSEQVKGSSDVPVKFSHEWNIVEKIDFVQVVAHFGDDFQIRPE